MKIEKINHLHPPSDLKRLYQILIGLDDTFNPKLSDRVSIEDYSVKLAQRAEVFYVTVDDIDVANCAVYMNQGNKGFITSFGVKKAFQRCGIGSQLMLSVLRFGKKKGIDRIDLEVATQNKKAVAFYLSHGFEISEKHTDWIIMSYIYKTKVLE